MIDKEEIEKQYRQHLAQFKEIERALEGSLRVIGKKFSSITNFKVTVQSPRTKDLTSLLKKIEKRLSEGKITPPVGSLFEIDETNTLIPVVNDFIGARVSCNTKKDVIEYADLLKNTKSMFELAKEEDFNKKDKVKESGYRALHLDMYYTHRFTDENTFEEKLMRIPVEIQIKTHLQTAWGEITHDESYKPDDGVGKSELETTYSRHIADLLDNLDEMAMTIRQQRLTTISPPENLSDDDVYINKNTLSYLISKSKKGETLTRQKMDILLQKLRDESIDTRAKAKEILENQEFENRIKKSKETLKNYENVSAYELLYYGVLLNKGKEEEFEKEIKKDYGYSVYPCLDCKRFLTEAEYKYMRERTDTDIDYFCGEHRHSHFPNLCNTCQKLMTSQQICKNCEAEDSPF